MAVRFPVLLVALALAASACGTSEEEEEGSGSALTGSWRLVSATSDGASIAVLEDQRITLVFESVGIGGSAACNSYGGPVEIAGDRFELGQIAMTEIGCEPAVAAAESAYLRALRQTDTIRLEQGRLVLRGASVELRFERLEPKPTRQLVGTRWELESIVEADVASGGFETGPTLRFDANGTFAGSTGCRMLRGAYVLGGDVIQVRDVVVDDSGAAGACSPAGEDRERIVLEVLRGDPRARIQAGRLTLASNGAYELVYRAE